MSQKASQLDTEKNQLVELSDEEKAKIALQKQIDNLILAKKIQEAIDLIDTSGGSISGSNYYIVFKVIHLDKDDFLPVLNEREAFNNSFPRDKFFEHLLKHKAQKCAAWLFNNNSFYSPDYLDKIKNSSTNDLPGEVKDILRKGMVALIKNDMDPLAINIFNNFIIHTCQCHSSMFVTKIRQHIAQDLKHIRQSCREYDLDSRKIDSFWKLYSNIFDVFFDKHAIECAIPLSGNLVINSKFKL